MIFLLIIAHSTCRVVLDAGFARNAKFAISNRSPSDPASVGARLISYNNKTSRTTPSTDPVSVVGRLLATHRGYTDAGSVQAKAEYQFSAVAQQSVVHRHRVGGARNPKTDTSPNKNLFNNTSFRLFAVQNCQVMLIRLNRHGVAAAGVAAAGVPESLCEACSTLGVAFTRASVSCCSSTAG